jgi:hypothetical protein
MNVQHQPKPAFNLAAKVKKDAAASGVPVKIKSQAALRRLAELLK